MDLHEWRKLTGEAGRINTGWREVRGPAGEDWNGHATQWRRLLWRQVDPLESYQIESRKQQPALPAAGGRSPASRTGWLGNPPQHPPSRLSLALTISPQPDLATPNLSSAIILDLESEEEGTILQESPKEQAR